MSSKTNISDSRPNLFLSYARGDDEPFVKQLYERLVSEGFSVWWDRECMPSRALTFLKEIRDAIRASDRVVVVVGPKCIASDYCRAEWQAALAETKVVNPLLRIGEHTQLPPELSSLHCPDFRNDAKFDDAFRETLRVLNDPIPPLGALMGGVPDVPPHFQPRPDDLSRLAAQLLSDEKRPITLTGPQRVTVLHGMGGAGKSVLAATFGRSTVTRRSFVDGIYWLNADDKATPLALTAGLGQLLGDPPQPHTDPITSQTQLVESLAGRSALVVVDNAWHVEQVEPLIDALGPSCRLLITTRDMELVTASGANCVELGELSPGAALQHLADWAGTAPEALPAEAKAVAKECGYLPFALALNGAMHQKGVSWSELAEALRSTEIDYAEQRFKGYPYPTVLKSIKVSMDALDKEDAAAGARLREIAAFHGSGGIPEAAVAVLWAHTAGYAARHVSKTLTQLAGKALIRLEGEAEARRVLVHDLQHDYLVRVTDATALSMSLLAAYEQACGGDWASVPADGYIHYHLVEHLLDTERVEAAHALLDESTPEGSNAWFEANAAIDNIIGYLTDLDRTRSKDTDDARAMRIGLMRTSVENTLTRIPAQLHLALLGEGKTTGANALASARCIDDPEKRVSALLALIPRLADSDRREVLTECLTTIRSRADMVQARFLPKIAAHFDGKERSALAAESLEKARSIDIPEYRAEGLGAVLPLLDEPLYAEASGEAAAALRKSVMSASFRDAASAVLPYMPELAPGLLDKVRTIEEPFLKAVAFEAVVPYLPESLRADAAREGIEHFEASRSNGLWIVISLARHIPDFDFDGLIRRAAAQDARQVPALIDALPEMLSADELKAALAAIATVADGFEEPNRTETRIRLLPYYPPARRSSEVDAILQEIPALPYESWRRDSYVNLIDHAERDQIPGLRKQLARLEDAGQVLEAAAEMAVYGDEALRGELFKKVYTLPPSREKFIALVALAGAQQDTQHHSVVEAAYELAGWVAGWEFMSEPAMTLARVLASEKKAYLLERAFDAAVRIGGFVSEREFVKLAPALPESTREAGFRFLLEDAERLSRHRQKYWAGGPKVTDNTFAVAETLAGIAPHLPAALLPEAVEMTRRIADERWRWAAICHIFPRLADVERETARQVVVNGAANGAFFVDTDELQRLSTGACRALSHAIPVLDGSDRDLLQNRLRELLHSVDPGWIPGLMEDVVPALTQNEAEALAERALAKPNVFTALAASKVIPAPRRWSLRLTALEGIPLGKSKDRVYGDLLAETVAALLEAPDELRLQAWLQACSRLRGERAAVALHLAALAPLGASVQRQTTLGAAARSLMDVQAWWP
jgi:hypothetical protein